MSKERLKRRPGPLVMMKQEAALGRGQSHKSHDIKGRGDNAIVDWTINQIFSKRVSHQQGGAYFTEGIGSKQPGFIEKIYSLISMAYALL